MQFDPALAAHAAFQEAEKNQELGSGWVSAAEAEETFANCAGPEAKEAYQELLSLGTQYPQAQAFQAFLIFSTWQQATEETIFEHFRTGAQLCQHYLSNFSSIKTDPYLQQIREIQQSFIAGMGEIPDFDEQALLDFDHDSFAGGD